jgi:hypothetical protein
MGNHKVLCGGEIVNLLRLSGVDIPVNASVEVRMLPIDNCYHVDGSRGLTPPKPLDGYNSDDGLVHSNSIISVWWKLPSEKILE